MGHEEQLRPMVYDMLLTMVGVHLLKSLILSNNLLQLTFYLQKNKNKLNELLADVTAPLFYTTHVAQFI